MSPEEKAFIDRITSETPHYPCGECDACCQALGVSPLGKPYYCSCEHQNGKGCAIYSSRPDECRWFACMWSAQYFGPDTANRPDKLGLLFNLEQGDGRLWLETFETRPIPDEDEEKYHAIIQRAWEIAQKLGCTGMRHHEYGSCVSTGFKIDGSKYPDEGEYKAERLYETRDQVMCWFVGPKRKNMKPLPMVKP